MSTSVRKLNNCYPSVVARLNSKGRARTVSSGLPTQARAAPQPPWTTLMITDADLGETDPMRSSITVQHPLEAIIRLQDESLAIGLVLAPLHDLRFNSTEFFAFMRDAYPRVRRYFYAGKTSVHGDALVATEDR
ncbi:hypothetical protein ACFL6C_03700 [Myxococcota bacterium]